MSTAVAPRIEPLWSPYPPEVGRTLERLMGNTGLEPLALFRIVAHHAEILERFRSTGTYLLNFGEVEPSDRELVIARTCARCGSEYEWGVHVVVYARALGLSEAEIAATVAGRASGAVWSERQRLLVGLADELHDSCTVSDELWDQLVAHWSPSQLIELITIAGQYHLVSYLTNALRIPPEPFAARFATES